jgi:hypothetical protein
MCVSVLLRVPHSVAPYTLCGCVLAQHALLCCRARSFCLTLSGNTAARQTAPLGFKRPWPAIDLVGLAAPDTHWQVVWEVCVTCERKVRERVGMQGMQVGADVRCLQDCLLSLLLLRAGCCAQAAVLAVFAPGGPPNQPLVVLLCMLACLPERCRTFSGCCVCVCLGVSCGTD